MKLLKKCNMQKLMLYPHYVAFAIASGVEFCRLHRLETLIAKITDLMLNQC